MDYKKSGFDLEKENAARTALARKLTYERKELNSIELDNKEMDNVSERISKKLDIPVQKARQELGMGVLLAIMMNRHRTQEINNEKGDI